jgi:hypothetical protein
MFILRKWSVKMDKFIGYFLILLGGLIIWLSLSQYYYENKQCTITITDMQGVQHQITGKSDE